MKALSAAVCVGVAAWCSLGTLGLTGAGPAESRIALLPPWWRPNHAEGDARSRGLEPPLTSSRKAG
ncbi:MAG: hypothetical protein A3H97_15855 [Acidobacteria bacterium RIFCSPLOWO2_02_FULL_65_29]|nr:MAG: hypothetical protein A3H97_15855 [Acidobacteria bacterium RIFCSPLOWO2_02_FULL_65_29]